MEFVMPEECREDFWVWCRENGIEIANEKESAPWLACWISACSSYASLSYGG